MPKKRTAAEANNNKRTNKGSDSLFQQQEDNAKRAKLTPLSDKTLQDLPVQLLECILVRAVAMEVKGMKMAKHVWKEKADQVINRLKNVCLSWSGILTTNGFLTEVHRILDGTAQEKIRLEVLRESLIHFHVLTVTTMKEEIFMLCKDEEDQTKINVYNRSDMAKVTDVIALPATRIVDVEACNASNSVYVLGIKMESQETRPSVSRITKDVEHQFNISPWISDLRMPVSTISVSSNGVLSVPHGQDPAAVNLYNVNGSLVLSADIYGFRYIDRVMQRSNGNLVLASVNGDHYRRVLTEIDTDGKIQWQYQSSLGEGSRVNFTDRHGRIVISKELKGVALLDSELNLFKYTGCKKSESLLLYQLHYNRERDEVMSIFAFGSRLSFLTIFRFAE